jgi:uncharacterized protein
MRALGGTLRVDGSLRAPSGVHAGAPTLERMEIARAVVRVVPANEYVRVRWSNGLGWTREIARGPEGDAWDWRLSIAEIERDAAFSRFEGIEREMVLVEGNGLRLRFGNGRVDELLPPHAGVRFPGEAQVQGEPLEGRATAFNLMWRRARIDAQLWRRPLVGAMVVFLDPRETWAVHLLAGQARFADGSRAPPLAMGDTALLRGTATRARCVLDGTGEALLVRLQTVG